MPNFVSNQPPWPKYFELSLVTNFFNSAKKKSLENVRLPPVTCEKFKFFYRALFRKMEPVYNEKKIK